MIQMAMEAEKTYIRPEIWTEQCGKAVRVDLPCRRRNKTEHRAFFFSAKDALRPVCDCSSRQNRRAPDENFCPPADRPAG